MSINIKRLNQHCGFEWIKKLEVKILIIFKVTNKVSFVTFKVVIYFEDVK